MKKANNEVIKAIKKLLNDKKISGGEYYKIYNLTKDDQTTNIVANIGVSIDLAKKLNNLIDLFIVGEISFDEYIKRREELIPNNLQGDGEQKEFDDNGELIENRESRCYVERDELRKSNLQIYNTTIISPHLKYVVIDMSTREYVFTSDSRSECEQWIEG